MAVQTEIMFCCRLIDMHRLNNNNNNNGYF